MHKRVRTFDGKQHQNMANISLYLDKRRTTKDGLCAVKIAIRQKKSVHYIATSVKVAPEMWNGKSLIEASAKEKHINKLLSDKVSQLHLQLLTISTTRDVSNLSAKDLAKLLDHREIADEATYQSVAEFFDHYISMKEKDETKAVYVQTRNRIDKFCRIDKLNFDDITYSWLCKFEHWMSANGNSVNTRSIHLRNLRAVYNAAIKEKVAKYEDYPFRDFAIKKEATEKRSLTIEQLRMFRDCKCDGALNKYVDVFFLIFYLAGINIVDLVNLPPLDVDGRIRYRRSKTGVLCELQVPAEALKIIDKYRGKEHLVNFIEEHASKRSFTLRVNKALQKVGDMSFAKIRAKNNAIHLKKEYKPLFPNITSYWARHTWATIAADLDIPDAVIDAALGHKSPYPMTDVYVRRNMRKVDEAVRKVIDYVNSNEV